MKREVKLNPNLRRLHSVTKTDKGKDKNKRKSSLCAGTQLVSRDDLEEPQSLSLVVTERETWSQMGDNSHGRSPTPTVHQPSSKLLLTIKIANTAPLSTRSSRSKRHSLSLRSSNKGYYRVWPERHAPLLLFLSSQSAQTSRPSRTVNS